MPELSWLELKEAGESHFENREFVEAANCFQRATKVNPTSAETWRALGFALQAAGKHADSVTVFKSAIGLEPNNPQAYFGVAQAYSGSGDVDRAIPAFDEALQIQPNNDVAREELIKLLLGKARRRLEAGDRYGEDDLERANKLSRNSPETAIPFIRHLLSVNLQKKALQVMEDAKAANPGHDGVSQLAQQIASDPALAHARRLQSMQPQKAVAKHLQRPAHNPDEITCPCGATKVMKWAIICPTCNQRIGDPTRRTSQFADRDDIPSTSWVEVSYIVVSVFWLVFGVWLVISGYYGIARAGEWELFRGLANVTVALGLLFQISWLQFVAKIMMVLNMLGGAFIMLISMANEVFMIFFIGFMTTAIAGFSWWVIGQLSD